jgi:hypothetical protein
MILQFLFGHLFGITILTPKQRVTIGHLVYWYTTMPIEHISALVSYPVRKSKKCKTTGGTGCVTLVFTHYLWCHGVQTSDDRAQFRRPRPACVLHICWRCQNQISLIGESFSVMQR